LRLPRRRCCPRLHVWWLLFETSSQTRPTRKPLTPCCTSPSTFPTPCLTRVFRHSCSSPAPPAQFAVLLVGLVSTQKQYFVRGTHLYVRTAVYLWLSSRRLTHAHAPRRYGTGRSADTLGLNLAAVGARTNPHSGKIPTDDNEAVQGEGTEGASVSRSSSLRTMCDCVAWWTRASAAASVCVGVTMSKLCLSSIAFSLVDSPHPPTQRHTHTHTHVPMSSSRDATLKWKLARWLAHTYLG
jgi:hypothetical protein